MWWVQALRNLSANEHETYKNIFKKNGGGIVEIGGGSHQVKVRDAGGGFTWTDKK